MGSLGDTAARVLEANWIEPWGFTVPSRRLYGHQWNWDSAMHVLAWARLRPDRAWRELRGLLAGQHPDGVVGHITFRPEEEGYFPGSDWWEVEPSAPLARIGSRITQPPLASVCLDLVDDLLAAAMPAYDPRPDLRALDLWHELLCEERGLHGEPIVVHPWETGRDNAIDWEPAFSAVPESTTRFVRLDLDAVRDAERPRTADYRRFIALLEEFRAVHFDQRRLAREARFRVLDPVFSLMTLRACRALERLGERHGEPEIAARQKVLGDQLAARLGARADGGWLDVDLLDAGGRRPVVSLARAVNVWREDLTPAQLDELAALVTDGALSSPAGVRSLAAGEAGYEPERYWRGPVWPHMTWWVAEGFRARGRADVAELLRRRTRDALEREGMREYLHPDDVRGLGASDQSWTAAVAVWWLTDRV